MKVGFMRLNFVDPLSILYFHLLSFGFPVFFLKSQQQRGKSISGMRRQPAAMRKGVRHGKWTIMHSTTRRGLSHGSFDPSKAMPTSTRFAKHGGVWEYANRQADHLSIRRRTCSRVIAYIHWYASWLSQKPGHTYPQTSLLWPNTSQYRRDWARRNNALLVVPNASVPCQNSHVQQCQRQEIILIGNCASLTTRSALMQRRMRTFLEFR